MKYTTYLLLSALFFTGCSGVEISGTVTYEEDGSPVESGKIIFSDEKSSFAGLIENGHYITGGAKNVQSIPYGTYKVWFSGIQGVERKPAGKTDASGQPVGGDYNLTFYPLIASEYESQRKTPLTFKVKWFGQKTFHIKVKKPRKDKE